MKRNLALGKIAFNTVFLLTILFLILAFDLLKELVLLARKYNSIVRAYNDCIGDGGNPCYSVNFFGYIVTVETVTLLLDIFLVVIFVLVFLLIFANTYWQLKSNW